MQDRITVETQVVRNLGDYNSLRVGAQLETDVSNEESLEDAYARAWSVVEEEVSRKIQEALS